MPDSFIEAATLSTSVSVHQSTPQLSCVHQVFQLREGRVSADGTPGWRRRRWWMAPAAAQQQYTTHPISGDLPFFPGRALTEHIRHVARIAIVSVAVFILLRRRSASSSPGCGSPLHSSVRTLQKGGRKNAPPPMVVLPLI